uniref:HMA domain-containing protein n=1 Tax=Kalanchoe fedtschenkoi TaxID=63787 RepID=A0A7N0T8Q8_KALFE
MTFQGMNRPPNMANPSPFSTTNTYISPSGQSSVAHQTPILQDSDFQIKSISLRASGPPHMAQQKVVLKVLTMTDDKTKQKAIEAAADIHGVDSIAADVKDQKLTVIGVMDAVAVVKKLAKKVGKVDLISVGPAKEEKKEEAKKAEEPKKEEPKKAEEPKK